MNARRESPKWFRSFNAGPARQVRLFLFPHAGGGATTFRLWPERLPDTIEVCAVQLAGRESRFLEAPVKRGGEIVDAVTQEIGVLDDAPFVLFGHSMGAILAFEVARRLRRIGGRSPAALIVSACCPPQLRNRAPRLGHLHGAELVRRSAELFGGIPPEMLVEKALVELMARVLEADLCVTEGYEYVAEEPLECPMAAYGGHADPWVTRGELVAWREHTRGGFVTEQYAGNHFYFRVADSERRLLEAVRQTCAAVVGRPTINEAEP